VDLKAAGAGERAHCFRVWAPRADAVDVKIGDQVHPLSPADDGTWSVAIAGAGSDTDYMFVLNHRLQVPDPRSRAWFCLRRITHAAGRSARSGS
jgi:1,4-alpha-glucan branching enzyme